MTLIIGEELNNKMDWSRHSAASWECANNTHRLPCHNN